MPRLKNITLELKDGFSSVFNFQIKSLENALFVAGFKRDGFVRIAEAAKMLAGRGLYTAVRREDKERFSTFIDDLTPIKQKRTFRRAGSPRSPVNYLV